MVDKKQHVLLCLALGQDTAKRVEDLPAGNGKEKAIMREAHQKGNVNRPGRS